MKKIGSSTSADSTVKGTTTLAGLSLVCAVISLLSGVLYMVWPGQRDSYSIQWDSHQRNILAPHVNYFPHAFHISGDCAALEQSALGTLFTTVPATQAKHIPNPNVKYSIAHALILVKNTDNTVSVSSRGTVIAQLTPKKCHNFVLDFNSSRVTTTVDGKQHITHGDLRPMVVGLSWLDSAQQQRPALHVTSVVDNHFEQNPSWLKSICGCITLIMVVLTGLLLARISRKTRAQQPTVSGSLYRPRKFYDLLVVMGLTLWHFIGANTADDGYILTMAKVREKAGYDPNYFRWFGAGESPFGWFYRIYTVLDRYSHATYWLRLPELILGIISWLILHHRVLPLISAQLKLSRPTRLSSLATASMFLLYWFTFNNGIRPEAIIATGFIIVVWFTLRAVIAHSIVHAYAAFVVSAYTIACGPTGIITIVPLIWLLTHHRSYSVGFFQGLHVRGSLITAVSAFILIGSAGSALLPIAFHHMDLVTLISKARMQTRLGPSLHWFQEQSRYTLLFSYSREGSMPRRIAVVSTGLALAYLALHHLLTRSVRTLTEQQSTPPEPPSPIDNMKSSLISWLGNYVPAKYLTTSEGVTPASLRLTTVDLIAICVGCFAVITLTPTKPTHHFGALVGVGVIAMAVATNQSTRLQFARNSQRIFLLAGVLWVIAFCYTGPNMYWFVSSANILWANWPIRIGTSIGTYLLLLAILTGFFAFCEAMKERQPVQSLPLLDKLLHTFNKFTVIAYAATKSVRYLAVQGVNWMSRSVLPLTVIVSVGLVFISFAVPALGTAAHVHGSAYSVAQANFLALTGDETNLAGQIMAESPGQRGLLSPENSLGTINPQFSPAHVPQSLLTDPEELTVTEISDLETSNTLPSYQLNTLSSARSYHLPYNLPQQTAFTGNYTGTHHYDNHLTSGWYALPENRNQRPLLVMTVAGPTTGISARFSDTAHGKTLATLPFFDPFPGDKWRNLTVALKDVPSQARYVQIVMDNNRSDTWTVLTTPRVPQLITMAALIGEDPVFLDWLVGLGVPTLHPFTVSHGIEQPAQWRVTADRLLIDTNTHWEDFRGGGPLGLIEGYASVTVWPTYMPHEPDKHFVALEKYVPYLKDYSTVSEPKVISRR